MVDGHLFDTLSLVAQRLRRTERPFGGIQVRPDHPKPWFRQDTYASQLVITGDFFQLPPVTEANTEPFFAFESSEWKRSIKRTVTLTHVFRQKDHSLWLVVP